MSNSLPNLPSAWCLRMQTAGNLGQTIHDVEPKSASKFVYDHFLLLRALWTAGSWGPSNAREFGLDVDSAKNILRSDPDWLRYCQLVGPVRQAPVPDVGRFTLPLHYQWEISQLKHGKVLDDTRAVLSPIAGRTRSKQSLHEKFAGLGMTATPTKSTGHDRKIPNFGADEESDVEEEEDVTLMYSVGSKRSPMSPEAARILFPPAGDEEIVNVALIDFANALVLQQAVSNT